MGGAGAALPDPSLYLFDGYNLLHAGEYSGVDELVDRLASFVALQGARGVVVFDGHGQDVTRGPLEVRYAPDADTLIERLAAEHRDRESVCLVSSDLMIRETSGREVRKLSSKTFLRDLAEAGRQAAPPGHLADRLDEETRARLERLRRGEKD
jgi:predicted RNA-binding protein with PIN domain